MFPQFIENLTQKVEGKNTTQNVTIFTLSTCMWCKKCKQYLKDKDIQYKYIDVDQIGSEQKKQIMDYLKENYKPDRIAYPFLVCDDKFVVGYDPNKYEEIIRQEGN